MNLVGRTSKAFKRSSSALCLVVAVGFLAMFLSAGYHILAYGSTVSELKKEGVPPENIMENLGQREPEVQEYENALAKVGQMGERERTQFYLFNNLGVAGFYAVGTPAYVSFHSLLYSGYSFGTNLSYWYYLGEVGKVTVVTDNGVRSLSGAETLLTFLASVFVHGVFELTGIFLVAAITLRAAWALWKGLGHMLGVTRRRGRLWFLRLSREEEREFQRHEGKLREFLVDFVLVAGVGAFLIFLGAPIESYISPRATAYFLQMHVLALAFLASIALFYFFICRWGFGAVRKNAKKTYEDLKLASKRRWRPAQLSFLMFVLSSVVVLVKFYL